MSLFSIITKLFILNIIVVNAILYAHSYTYSLEGYNRNFKKNINAELLFNKFEIFRELIISDLNSNRNVNVLKKYLCKDRFIYWDNFRNIYDTPYLEMDKIQNEIRWEALLNVLKNAHLEKRKINGKNEFPSLIFLNIIDKYNSGNYPTIGFDYDFENEKWEITAIYYMKL